MFYLHIAFGAVGGLVMACVICCLIEYLLPKKKGWDGKVK